MKKIRLLFTLFLATHFLVPPSMSQEDITWRTTIENLGSFSSPRATDLNGDGVKDIVLGAGKNPFVPLDSGVMAFNGKTGAVMWAVPAYDQVFGSPVFLDITRDGVDDVFINGRSGVLKAINGKSGQVIWNFIPENNADTARARGWYNFYSPQFIRDVDGDGIRDLVVSCGGDHLIDAFDPNRPTGRLAVISSRTGEVISMAEVPDGKETYMSVVLYGSPENPVVIYGTGGETIPGGLYATTLNDLLRGDISRSILIAKSDTKGFIAPPALVDLTKDGIPEIVVNSFDGRMIAIDGNKLTPLWSTGIRYTEVYSTLTVGHYNEDDTPDFFTTVNTGVWPEMEYAISLVVDGKRGSIVKTDTVGYYQMVSGVAADIDANGVDEVFLHTNFPHNDDTSDTTWYTNTVFLFDFHHNLIQKFGPTFRGAKQASTPWIGDLDDDGYYDMVMLYQTDIYNYSIFGGIEVVRLNLGIKIQKEIAWGSYMGTYYDGTYRLRLGY